MRTANKKFRSMYCGRCHHTIEHKLVGNTNPDEKHQGSRFQCPICKGVKIVLGEFLEEDNG